jgi:trimethylamine:corrinoid methyltransferase-like protein
MALRLARGIEVDDGSLALDLIKEVGQQSGGNYLSLDHTARRFRQEHYIPRLLVREPYDTWAGAGESTALDRARERARQILEKHQRRELDPAMEQALDDYRQMVAQRPLDDFYLYELAERQDWDNL